MGTYSTGPTLVIQTFELSREGRHDVYVVLEGRPEGLISFLLSLIGLATQVRFEVSKNCVSKRTLGLWSRQTQAIPCQNVGSTEFGYSRNFLAAVVAVLFLLLALGSYFAANITNSLALPREIVAEIQQMGRDTHTVVAGASGSAGLFFLIIFLLSKRLVILVETGGGRQMGVKFRPGLVEGVSLTITTVEAIVDQINSLARGE